MLDRIKILLQYLIPQHGLSLLAGKLADSKKSWIKDPFIKYFARAYQIDLKDAEIQDFNAFPTFNDFFTRALRSETRPIVGDPQTLCSPVDGRVSEFGNIADAQILQAKGHHYSVASLLGRDDEYSRLFEDGQFATLYLAPNDYHRFHIPCDGELLWMRHVPGKLFSVNPLTARHVPGLFARNERVVALFETPFGKMAYVAVGATIVGSIEIAWHGTVTPPSRSDLLHIDYNSGQHCFNKGEEVGRFKLGSTVILLLQKNNWRWAAEIGKGRKVRMGQALISNDTPTEN